MVNLKWKIPQILQRAGAQFHKAYVDYNIDLEKLHY